MTASQQLPSWLAEHLDATGVLDSQTRLTRTVRARRCPFACGRFVLAGLDDVLNQPLYVDAMPTTAVGELKALLLGRRTYTLIHGNLCHRDSHRIDYRCADLEPVHAEHSCSAPWLPVNKKFAPTPTRTVTHDEPPF